MKICAWVAPSPVEVYTSQRGPRISQYDTVWIDHGYQFNDIIVQHFIIFLVILSELLKNMAHNKASMSLRRVHSGLYVDTCLLSVFYRPSLSPLGDGYLINVKATNTLGNYLLPKEQIFIRDFKIALFHQARVLYIHVTVIFKLVLKLVCLHFLLFFCTFLHLYFLYVKFGFLFCLISKLAGFHRVWAFGHFDFSLRCFWRISSRTSLRTWRKVFLIRIWVKVIQILIIQIIYLGNLFESRRLSILDFFHQCALCLAQIFNELCVAVWFRIGKVYRRMGIFLFESVFKT